MEGGCPAQGRAPGAGPGSPARGSARSARRAAAVLRAEFGAKRVVLFGSALNLRWFHERSDVDLAAWGIPWECYLRAVARCLDLDPAIRVDLVRAEEAPPGLLQRIEDEGVDL